MSDPNYDPPPPGPDPALAGAAYAPPDQQSGAPAAPQPLEIPTERQEWLFEGDIQSAPNWVDKGWAGYDRGPAVHVPQGDIDAESAYTTKTARIGDTIVFIPAKGAKVAHYEIIEAGDESPEDVANPTKEVASGKPTQASGASLEDQLKLGTLTVEEMTPDAKAQVAARSPKLAKRYGLDDPAVVSAKAVPASQ